YYPGHRGQLELLHSGILGSGTRPLLNGNLAPQKTLTVIDVSLESQETTYTTYDMRTMELVDMQQLPRLIVGPNGMVLRRDVNEADLTAEERSLQYVSSY
ncbi:MAG: metallophosphoesterase, partial [Leptolyngbyaceae cyanobacterium RM2_2_4]|nr:metallophosphoesterase [Leptolyngbyaceae cyanobacterium RM2_2_4]